MRERSRRFILFLAAASIAAMLFFKGHGSSPQDGSVAFLPCTSSGVTIRLKGVVQVPGVYVFHNGVTVADVINLTASGPTAVTVEKPLHDTRLTAGDVVEVSGENPRTLAISLKRMKAGELMLLNIPLHPDQMDFEDWDSLPGIGPVMARNILEDRQNNGEYCSVEALQRVSGMGGERFKRIRKYFDP